MLFHPDKQGVKQYLISRLVCWLIVKDRVIFWEVKGMLGSG